VYKTIYVKAVHIRLGEPKISDSCPVALALQNQGFPDAFVGCNYFYRFDGDKKQALKPRTINWIKKFDTTRLGKTFKFRIKVSSKQSRAGRKTRL